MIGEIMDYLNNHFVISGYGESDEYEIVSDGIQTSGSFVKTYVVGMYVWIVGSILSDGVYKVTAVASNKLTLDGTFLPENTGETISLYGLKPPQPFLSLVDDITTWQASYGTKAGLAGEAIDSYSYSIGSGPNGQTNTWQSAYASKLSTYRKMYEDYGGSSCYGWQNKSGCC